jgi:hypothetical protein
MSELIMWAQQIAMGYLYRPVPSRWKHVQGVARRIEVAALHDPEESALLVSAAILHDVGYAPELVATGLHSLDSARYLRKIGASERLCALVAHHSCALQEAKLRGLSTELAEWVDERTSLRDALWWADMTTSPDGDTVSFEWRLADIRKRYGPGDVVTAALELAEPELGGAVERTEARLRAARIAY